MARMQPAQDLWSRADWRFKSAIGLFVLMILLLLAIPVLAVSSAPAATVAAYSGGVFIFNKILIVAIVALVGKSGFQELKSLAVSYLPRLGAVGPVGPVRHAIGLVMFCVPLAWSMLERYIDYFWPALRPDRWEYQMAGDLIFLASFVVLGGNFWEKVRALFIRTARVIHETDHTPR